jgi:hypothetical protein
MKKHSHRIRKKYKEDAKNKFVELQGTYISKFELLKCWTLLASWHVVVEPTVQPTTFQYYYYYLLSRLQISSRNGNNKTTDYAG